MSERNRKEAGTDGCSVTGVLPKVSEREMQALNALAGSYDSDFCCLTFKAIARRSKLDPKHVRRSVRALARKGLAEYVRGLWTEDGDPAGSGYRCTVAGNARASDPIYPEWD